MRTLTTLAALTSLSASLAACLGEVPTSRKAARKTASTTACTRLDKDLTIRAAADLAALPKTGCYDVYGKLSLQGSQVTSLAMLGGINSVDELELDHTALTTVDAKQAIGLYGKLTVTGNAKLTSLTNLTFEAASTGILIDANPALATVDALGLDQPKLTEVRGDLVITGNAALATLPLRNLTKVTGALTVHNNGALTSIDLTKLAAAGLPVISTTHCDIPAEVLHDRTGLLAAEGDTAALAAHIRRFYHLGNADYQIFSRNARRHVETGFDVKKQAAHLASVYAEAMTIAGFKS